MDGPILQAWNSSKKNEASPYVRDEASIVGIGGPIPTITQRRIAQLFLAEKVPERPLAFRCDFLTT